MLFLVLIKFVFEFKHKFDRIQMLIRLKDVDLQVVRRQKTKEKLCHIQHIICKADLDFKQKKNVYKNCTDKLNKFC